jgi:Zn-dependent peptidase ImmA (M78 family)
MYFFLKKVSRMRFGWNKRPLDEVDFERLCRRFRITVQEMPLRTNGFYYCVKGRHFIAIDSRLPRIKKLLVMFHEFAHFMMHVPDEGVTANFHGIGRRTKKEAEADAFAICALIPRTLLEARTLDELIEEGFTREILEERINVFESYGF